VILTGQVGSKFKLSLFSLDCNEECRVLERNRRLAIGLQIRNPDLSQKLTPRYSVFHAGLGEEGPPVLPEDPRQAGRAGPTGQAEQAEEQGVLVRVDEQGQETLRARILRTLRLRQRRLRHGTQQKHRRHRVQGQILVAQHEPPGVSPEGERPAQGAGAGLEQGIGGEVGDFRGL
jgi:hypothetical protein